MKQELTIATISAEPKQTSSGKSFWIATDSEDTEWLVWSKELADAVRERKLQATEYELNISQKGDKTFRSIQGIPGVIEPQRQFSGRKWQPRDHHAEEQAKWPSFALSYAKDIHIAKCQYEGESIKTKEIVSTAEDFMKFLQEFSVVPAKDESVGAGSGGTSRKESPPLGDSQPGEVASSTAPTPNLQERALKLPLIAKIKELDPNEVRTDHSILRGFSLAELENIYRSLKAEEIS